MDTTITLFTERGNIMLEKQIVLDILKRTKNLLAHNAIFEAKEYLELEIHNLEGTTPQNCNNIFKSFFCKKCSNLNCPANKNR